MTRPRRDPTTAVAPAARAPVRRPRWLLFVHQHPSTTSNVRVRTWRRLQQIGALAVKQALYVLPDSPDAREDLEWLKTEIEAAGGQASVFAADAVDSWSTDALVDEFRRSRQASYDRLAREAQKLLKGSSRRPSPGRALQQLKERLAAIERIDFFGSAGRDRVLTLIYQIEERGRPFRAGSSDSGAAVTPDYTGRRWVTRPRPGIDRIASAWLIRRFIDRKALFGFVADREAAPRDAVPFDMFGVEFTHRGEWCTFETLAQTFTISDAAVDRLAAIVHDLDLKDPRFGAPETGAVGALVDGLRELYADDHLLLEQGMTMFEALYRAFAHAERRAGPRPVAGPRRKSSRPRRRRG